MRIWQEILTGTDMRSPGFLGIVLASNCLDPSPGSDAKLTIKPGALCGTLMSRDCNWF
jgi:hypothetical protein